MTGNINFITYRQACQLKNSLEDYTGLILDKKNKTITSFTVIPSNSFHFDEFRFKMKSIETDWRKLYEMYQGTFAIIVQCRTALKTTHFTLGKLLDEYPDAIQIDEFLLE